MLGPRSERNRHPSGGDSIPSSDLSQSLRNLQLRELLGRITSDGRFRENQNWGEIRPGHPEGTIQEHVAQLLRNLDYLVGNFPDLPRILTEEGIIKLKILITVHDSMKPEAKAGVPVEHQKNHAALAARFLREIGGPNDLVLMTKLHDEPHALYRKSQRGGTDALRLERLLHSIPSWDLFLTFQVCDKVGPGRDLQSIRWLVTQLRDHQVGFIVPAEKMIDVLCGALCPSLAQPTADPKRESAE